jgi:hypothetical protein
LIKSFPEKDSTKKKDNILEPLPITDNPIKKELRQYNTEVLNILPRSNNWDVKKILEPKLEKLKRRTQRAIVDFLREKLDNASDSGTEDDA